ncbi:MAG: glycosyltransferase, partial [Myxococcota bacterium]|nr:glycosyltransferase [Myxococcota bacterium]
MDPKNTEPRDARAAGLWLLLCLVTLGTVLGQSAPGEALGMGVLALVLVAWSSRVILWWRYDPMEPTPEELSDLPTLTVVIPAFNEGVGVARAIESVLESDYPQERLHVIAVNDGSTDDTGAHIDRLATRWPQRVTAIHLPRNQGKRHALYAGHSRAASEIVATLDSDSQLLPHSLSHLVTPLVRDPEVAGVAGKVLAMNRRENLLTRMLGVRYILGFDFVRAYQSQLRTVWCCPGALQAYRRDLIAPHLEAWRDQRFLGARCTNGDDHAMTNLVLSLGHSTVYQSNAEVRTVVPSAYGKLCRMYTRWGRSATREGLRALAFAGDRALSLGPVRGSLMLLDALLQPLTIAARLVGLGAMMWLLYAHPMMVVSSAVVTTLVAVAYAVIFLRSER